MKILKIFTPRDFAFPALERVAEASVWYTDRADFRSTDFYKALDKASSKLGDKVDALAALPSRRPANRQKRQLQQKKKFEAERFKREQKRAMNAFSRRNFQKSSRKTLSRKSKS